MLNNSNDDVSGFLLTKVKRCHLTTSSWSLKPTADHATTEIPTAELPASLRIKMLLALLLPAINLTAETLLGSFLASKMQLLNSNSRKNLPILAVEEMKVVFSLSSVPFKPSSNKKKMKVEYRQIMISWPIANSQGESQGYAVQLGKLLETCTGVDLGQSMALHPLKVLNIKSVHTYKMWNASVMSLKKRIAKRKATAGGEAITTKKPATKGYRPIKVRSDTSSEAAERLSPAAGSIVVTNPVAVVVGDLVEKMVVENPHLEDSVYPKLSGTSASEVGKWKRIRTEVRLDKEIEDVPIKAAEHEAPDYAEETRSEPVLDQQAQDLEQRASDQTEEHLAQEEERQAHIDTEEQRVPAQGTTHNNEGFGSDRDMAMAQSVGATCSCEDESVSELCVIKNPQTSLRPIFVFLNQLIIGIERCMNRNISYLQELIFEAFLWCTESNACWGTVAYPDPVSRRGSGIIKLGRETFNTIKISTNYEPFIGRLVSYLAGDLRLAPTGITRRPALHDSIGYPRMSASGESSTTMHRLLHASGPHPIPPPNDPNGGRRLDDWAMLRARRCAAGRVPLATRWQAVCALAARKPHGIASLVARRGRDWCLLADDGRRRAPLLDDHCGLFCAAVRRAWRDDCAAAARDLRGGAAAGRPPLR
ncbi:hypothetical protein F511_28706 [Dorcoceras hygrometricum]|uniref:Uncharacterized protein n=1 Tax=Dorcoceras hygrometricum TaxID=472368 RepID=A0A2Z7C5W0_9LAMI|nr:hypothetical protein F511_28706 [Dorcoceras hygrometricum]